MKNLLSLFLINFLLSPLILNGQGQIVLKGKITDKGGNPLIEANVSIVNEPHGSSTDANGEYIFKLPDEYLARYVVLEIKYVGFVSKLQEIKISAGVNTYNFIMQRDILSIKPIIVNAQRREENLQDVPISITAITNKDIVNRDIHKIEDLQYTVPNFFIGDGTFTRRVHSSIRGIAGASRAPGVEKRANYYVDDAYLGRSIAVNMNLFDIERIEILKGPQGTLFGKNTISGVINITTRKPFDGWEQKFSFDAGNLSYMNTIVVLNVPFVEKKFFTRFSGRFARRDGHVKNLFNNQDMNGINIMSGRLQFRYLPQSNIDIILSLHGLNDNRDRRAATELLAGPDFDAAPKPRELSHDADEFAYLDIYGAALNMNYVFVNNYNLKSITSYRIIDLSSSLDEDYGPEIFYFFRGKDDDEHFTQEFRLSSPLFPKFNFVSGLFYFNQKSRQKFHLWGTPDAPLPNYFLLSDGPVRTNSIAGYFHGNFNLTEKTTIFGGLRYTYEHKKINWFQKNRSDSGALYVNVDNYEATYSKGVFSPQIGLKFEPNKNLMLFAKTTWGYKSGGFGNHTVQDVSNLKLRPEYAINYESGFKLSAFNQKVIFNGAVFFNKFDDYQTEVWRPSPFGMNLPVYTNAAEVSSKGFEVEVFSYPLENLSLMASFGYVDAKYDKFTAQSEYNYNGNKLEMAPENEYSFSFEYRLPVNNIGNIILKGNFIHKDDFFFDAANGPNYLIEGYELFNGKIGYENFEGSLGIYLWGKNLTDKLYMLTRAITPTNNPAVWYGLPRTFGIKFTYSLLTN